MDTLAHDVRGALRTIRREPGWAALCALTVALGVGANAAIFSVTDHALLRPLPFAEPDRLVAVWGLEPAASAGDHPSSYPDFLDYQRETTSFAGLAAHRRLDLALTGAGQEPARVKAAAASRELFGLLGVAPLLGRTFTPEEDRPGAPGAVLLSEGLWRERWGGRKEAIGETVQLDGQPHTVVGVLPASFRFPRGARLWVAAGPQRRNEYRGVHSYAITGRLHPGVGLDQAGAELAAVAARLATAYPGDNAGRSARVQPLHEALIGSARSGYLLLLGAAGLVLLVTCSNLAALLASRASRRGRELAVRLSLGASRARLVRQLLTETLGVLLLGSLLGLGAAVWSVPALLAMAPADLPRLDEVAFDARVAAVCLAATLVTALAFGIAPALLAARVQPAAALRSESGRATAAPGRLRVRQVLALAQTALAVVLLSGAGLLIRSLWALGQVEPGFRLHEVMVGDFQLPEARYPGPVQAAAFHAELLRRVRALPGVEAAGLGSADPFAEGWGARFGIEGRPPFPQGQEPEPVVRMISPGYLATTGIRLLRGRDIEERDRLGAPGAVLVNETMAARFFPGTDPVGQRLTRRWWAPEMPQTWEIVGLVADVRTGSLEEPTEEAIYYPAAQVPFNAMTLLVRSSRDAASLGAELRVAVHALDPELPFAEVRSLQGIVEASLGPRRFQATLLVLFAGLALLLAGAGLYGVLAALVAQRGHEIAVRLALGALRSDVAALVASQAARLCGAGLGLGLLGALALAVVLRGLLYEVQPADPLTLGAVVAAVAGIAALASLAPLLRALAIDPAVALRGE